MSVPDELPPAELAAAITIARRLDSLGVSIPTIVKAVLKAAAHERLLPVGDGRGRDPAAVALLRQQADALHIMLICPCGQSQIDKTGNCPVCTERLPEELERAAWDAEHAEAIRRNTLAAQVECPYCGAAAGRACITRPTGKPLGIRDHKDRYRAACHLLARTDVQQER